MYVLSVSDAVARARGEGGHHPGFTVKRAPRDGAIGGEARGVAHPGPCRAQVMPGVEAQGGACTCMHAPVVTRWSRRAGAQLVSGSLPTPQGSPMPQVGGASPGPNKAPEVAQVSRWLYPYPTPGVIAAPRGRPGAGEARGAGHPGTGPANVKPERDLTPLRARSTASLT